MAIAAVLAERHFAQEEIAHGIEPVMPDHGKGVDDIANRLRHLLAAVEEEPVAEYTLGQSQSRRHQEGRPVDRVKADIILSDDVVVGRPEPPYLLLFIRSADRIT